MWFRLAWNWRFSCFSSPGTGIRGIHYHSTLLLFLLDFPSNATITLSASGCCFFYDHLHLYINGTFVLLQNALKSCYPHCSYTDKKTSTSLLSVTALSGQDLSSLTTLYLTLRILLFFFFPHSKGVYPPLHCTIWTWIHKSL